MKILWIIPAIFLVACTDHSTLASEYNLELQYYQYSVNFANLDMNTEAYEACTQTKILRNECFTSLVQNFMANDIFIPKEFCDQIIPNEKMPMTMTAFEVVYNPIDEDLRAELKEKLNPSKKRINTLKQIKEECYQA